MHASTPFGFDRRQFGKIQSRRIEHHLAMAHVATTSRLRAQLADRGCYNGDEIPWLRAVGHQYDFAQTDDVGAETDDRYGMQHFTNWGNRMPATPRG